jgi:excinuclease ABC subunit C
VVNRNIHQTVLWGLRSKRRGANVTRGILRLKLLSPVPAVKRALELLPHQPGVYILRDGAGRVIYVGRSRDLSSRVRTYWSDLRDRPHLVRMVERVAWLEPVLCASEHEAAFLESDLLERHPTRYNRTLGMESRVWLRLDATPAAPSLEVVHEARPGDGAAWFGPYLGWEPARQAAAGLQRLYPLRYSGTGLDRSDRELARSLSVLPGDTADLAGRIERVLRRDRAAVRAAIRGLEAMRDQAAELEMFEHAGVLQQQIRGLSWITEPQKLSSLEPFDHDFCAVAATRGVTVLVILALRGGHMTQRHVTRLSSSAAWPDALAAHGRRASREPVPLTLPGQRAALSIHQDWLELAQQNAELMVGLAAADAIGPLQWR